MVWTCTASASDSMRRWTASAATSSEAVPPRSVRTMSAAAGEIPRPPTDSAWTSSATCSRSVTFRSPSGSSRRRSMTPGSRRTAPSRAGMPLVDTSSAQECRVCCRSATDSAAAEPGSPSMAVATVSADQPKNQPRAAARARGVLAGRSRACRRVVHCDAASESTTLSPARTTTGTFRARRASAMAAVSNLPPTSTAMSPGATRRSALLLDLMVPDSRSSQTLSPRSAAIRSRTGSAASFSRPMASGSTTSRTSRPGDTWPSSRRARLSCRVVASTCW